MNWKCWLGWHTWISQVGYKGAYDGETYVLTEPLVWFEKRRCLGCGKKERIE